jgi:hypothetical protein
MGIRAGIHVSMVVGLCALPAHAFAACGDRGGPGYRGPDGKCVGWAALARVCGNPPSTRCTAEVVQSGADESAEQGSKIRKLMDDAHQRTKGSRR